MTPDWQCSTILVVLCMLLFVHSYSRKEAFTNKGDTAMTRGKMLGHRVGNAVLPTDLSFRNVYGVPKRTLESSHPSVRYSRKTMA